MRQHQSLNLPTPDADALAHSRRLEASVVDRINSAGGAISFADFMEMALYEPGLGYYLSGNRPISTAMGGEGDFVTAPALGPLFGRTLARQIGDLADGFRVEGIKEYEILELGAGSGALARTLLNTLPAAQRPRRYTILDRSGPLRAQQQENLADVPVPVCWRDKPPEADWQGVLLANEVIDALPVERFQIDAGGTQQITVVAGDEGLALDQRPAPLLLAQQIDRLRDTLPNDLPIDAADGYRSEICTLLPAWLETVGASLRRGVALFIDYGYPRSEYYLPERRDGTLICHYRHRAHGDALRWPGLQDITASVDFTAVAEAGHRAGFQLAGYTTQAQFLLACGLTELLEDEQWSERQRLQAAGEAKQLLLPGEMGERFQVMALSRGYDGPVPGFELRDLSHRL